MIETNNKPLPCPCCGGEAILGVSPPMPAGRGETFNMVGIVCESCGLSVTETARVDDRERERAEIVLGKWNIRQHQLVSG